MDNNVNETINAQQAEAEVVDTNEINKIAPSEEDAAENVEAPEVVDTRDYELRISEEELAKKKRRLEIWDKITTGLLIFLMASPILILTYIFLWFVFR